MKKIVAILLGVALFGFASFGCISKGGGNSKPIIKDTISSIYITNSKDQIILIGNKYEYVFDSHTIISSHNNMNLLADAITLSDKIDTVLYLSKDAHIDLHTDETFGDKLATEFTLSIKNDEDGLTFVSQYDQFRTEKIFYKTEDKSRLETRIILKGNRYKPNKKVLSHIKKLKKPFELHIIDLTSVKVEDDFYINSSNLNMRDNQLFLFSTKLLPAPETLTIK